MEQLNYSSLYKKLSRQTLLILLSRPKVQRLIRYYNGLKQTAIYSKSSCLSVRLVCIHVCK